MTRRARAPRIRDARLRPRARPPRRASGRARRFARPPRASSMARRARRVTASRAEPPPQPPRATDARRRDRRAAGGARPRSSCARVRPRASAATSSRAAVIALPALFYLARDRPSASRGAGAAHERRRATNRTPWSGGLLAALVARERLRRRATRAPAGRRPRTPPRRTWPIRRTGRTIPTTASRDDQRRRSGTSTRSSRPPRPA